MDILSIIMMIILNQTVPLQSVSVDNQFITGDSLFKAENYSLDATNLSIYDDCNLRPTQYAKYNHKLIKGNCENCLREIWKITGVSMNPTLKTGNLLKMQMQPDVSKLKEGMIAVYDPRDDLKGSPLNMTNAENFNFNIIHRIVAVQQDAFIIKGDNPETNGLCEYIPKSSIKAVLESIDY